jgi:thiamine biosynthesis lipoprotein
VPTTASGVGTETRFRAMGTDVHILLVDAPPGLVETGRALVADLEARWSRFLPGSEVTALNRNAGRPVIVSADTFDLVAKAHAAWRATDGRFDATVGRSMVAHGYDRDLPAVRAAVRVRGEHRPAPTLAGLTLVPAMSSVGLPGGVVFDPGGIGKGLAADLTAARLLDAGARGALVNIGGDLRAVGEAPTSDGWVVTVPDPADPHRELLRLCMAEGSVATSSVLLRRWATTTGEAHHLIDPSTGAPAETDVSSVTVVAGDAWWAEAQATSLTLLGPDGLASLRDAHAVMVLADGTRHATDGIRGAVR